LSRAQYIVSASSLAKKEDTMPIILIPKILAIVMCRLPALFKIQASDYQFSSVISFITVCSVDILTP